MGATLVVILVVVVCAVVVVLFRGGGERVKAILSLAGLLTLSVEATKTRPQRKPTAKRPVTPVSPRSDDAPEPPGADSPKV